MKRPGWPIIGVVVPFEFSPPMINLAAGWDRHTRVQELLAWLRSGECGIEIPDDAWLHGMEDNLLCAGRLYAFQHDSFPSRSRLEPIAVFHWDPKG